MTPNQIARAVLDRQTDPWPDDELIVLAKAFLEVAEAWRAFDQERLDAVLLTGDVDE